MGWLQEYRKLIMWGLKEENGQYCVFNGDVRIFLQSFTSASKLFGILNGCMTHVAGKTYINHLGIYVQECALCRFRLVEMKEHPLFYIEGTKVKFKGYTNGIPICGAVR